MIKWEWRPPAGAQEGLRAFNAGLQVMALRVELRARPRPGYTQAGAGLEGIGFLAPGRLDIEQAVSDSQGALQCRALGLSIY